MIKSCKPIVSVPNDTEIKETQAIISPFILKTPIIKSEGIDKMLGCNVFFKCENFQKVGAFKMRGASNAVARIMAISNVQSVATHSSGNHAAALAKAAQFHNIKSYIVMPSNAPEIKKSAVKSYGGVVIECEPTLQARESTLNSVVLETKAHFVHPYDNYDVIAGQATAALEVLEETEVDAIFAPVGGGGLLAGTALSAAYFGKKNQVFGCEPDGADDAYRSFISGILLPQHNPRTIADGLLTSLGQKNWPIIKEHVSNIFTVTDSEIKDALLLIFERLKIVVEPSCAVPLAALFKNKDAFKGQKISIILSGGNIDLKKYLF